MSLAVYRRTLKDQLRFRTYLLLALLALIGWGATFGTASALSTHDPTGSPEYLAEHQAEFAAFDGGDGFAVFLNAPVINGVVFLILFAVLMASSTVAGEWQNKTGFLLFSKPVPRYQIVLAKIFGVYTWIVIGVAVAGVAIMVGAAMGGVARVAPAELFIGLAWLSFAMLPIVAFASFVAFSVRRAIPAVFMALAVVALVAPVVAQAGFFVAMQDDEFRRQGVYPGETYPEDLEQIRACVVMNDPGWRSLYDSNTHAELDAAYAEEKANLEAAVQCKEDVVGDVDAFYVERGAEPRSYGLDYQACMLDAVYGSWRDDGAGGGAFEGDTPAIRACDEQRFGDETEVRRAREEAFAKKFERPLIDAPRYLSMTAVLSSWTLFADWTSQDAPELARFAIEDATTQAIASFLYAENGAGASSDPLSKAGSLLGVLANAVVWTGLAILSVMRRDLA